MTRFVQAQRNVLNRWGLVLSLGIALSAGPFFCRTASADTSVATQPPITQQPVTQPADTQPTVTETAPASFDPADPPAGMFVDEWYTVLMGGRKCGQMRIRMDRVSSPDGDRIVTQTKMQMTVQRTGIEITVATYNKTTETLDGKPLSFRRETHLAQQPLIVEGTISNDEVRVVSSQLGQELPERTYALPRGAMMDWAVYREQFKRGLEPGTRYTLDLYEPSISLNRLCTADIEIQESETVDLYGRRVEAVRTRQVMHIPSGHDRSIPQETISWITPDGQNVRFEMSVMDMAVEVIAVPKSIAMAPNDPAELLLDMVIPLGRSLDADRLDQVTYRVRFEGQADESPLKDLPETAVQKITGHDENEALVQVTRPSALSETPPAIPLSESERARYLAASPVLNYHDPRIVELVEQAAGQETDPRRLAQQMMHFVDRYIEEKSFDIGFATASEVARSRQGDCTEHGVLLAAMGRAKDIPTRLVTGLLYVDAFAGRRDILAGHLWTQFWIDGQWVDLDATRPTMDPPPIYIALTFSAADDAGFADLIASTWLNIARLKIEVATTKTRQ